MLQARRQDDPARLKEVRSFAERCELDESQILVHDLLQEPPDAAELRDCDAIFMGGSGDFFVSRKDLPIHDALVDFLLTVVDRGFPMFASCFGFQYLIHAHGGEIIHDPASMELGTLELTLTSAGKADPLFGELPAVFMAQLGHKDRAVHDLPQAVTLARSILAPVQAIAFQQKPIWATQFHPELDRGSNLERFLNYLDRYAPHLPPDEQAVILQRFQESPHTHGLLSRFLQLVF